MSQKRSMDEAIMAARELRSRLDEKGTPSGETAPAPQDKLRVLTTGESKETVSVASPEPASLATPQGRPRWVRHTVGLQESTSLMLRDAADAQKRKLRHGTLGAEEPANEQEIADLGIRLALQQLGASE